MAKAVHMSIVTLFCLAWLYLLASSIWYCVVLKIAFDFQNECLNRTSTICPRRIKGQEGAADGANTATAPESTVFPEEAIMTVPPEVKLGSNFPKSERKLRRKKVTPEMEKSAENTSEGLPKGSTGAADIPPKPNSIVKPGAPPSETVISAEQRADKTTVPKDSEIKKAELPLKVPELPSPTQDPEVSAKLDPKGKSTPQITPEDKMKAYPESGEPTVPPEPKTADLLPKSVASKPAATLLPSVPDMEEIKKVVEPVPEKAVKSPVKTVTPMKMKKRYDRKPLGFDEDWF